MKIIKWILVLFIAVLIVTFAVSNRDTIELTIPIINLSITSPLYLFFFATLILGVMLGGYFIISGKIKLMAASHGYKKRIRELEKEVRTLKLEKQLDSKDNNTPLPHPQLPPNI